MCIRDSSYTAFFSGEKLWVEDMTIENDAGPGAKAGQAIAAYVDLSLIHI